MGERGETKKGKASRKKGMSNGASTFSQILLSFSHSFSVVLQWQTEVVLTARALYQRR